MDSIRYENNSVIKLLDLLLKHLLEIDKWQKDLRDQEDWFGPIIIAEKIFGSANETSVDNVVSFFQELGIHVNPQIFFLSLSSQLQREDFMKTFYRLDPEVELSEEQRSRQLSPRTLRDVRKILQMKDRKVQEIHIHSLDLRRSKLKNDFSKVNNCSEFQISLKEFFEKDQRDLLVNEFGIHADEALLSFEVFDQYVVNHQNIN